MLSTFSSFLPSALSDRLDRLDLRSDDPSNQQQTEPQGVSRIDMAKVSEDSNKKQKKKKVSSNETFIVVRPPPAKSNHPLNLQLQLVPAHSSRDRPSTSSSATPTLGISGFSTDLAQGIDTARPPPSPPTSDSEHGLRRTLSLRSNRSDTSAFYASSVGASGSVTSFASTASAASGRRMIIPLYNLSAHNVRANTILDAGTDARVAKFHKRGLEIVDLAMLEPTEVWFDKDSNSRGTGAAVALDPFGVPIRRSCSCNSSLAPLGPNGSRTCTPDPSQSPGSSGLSVASDHSSAAAPQPRGDLATTSTSTPTGSKKLFGKLFRKKEGSSSGGQSLPSISVATVASSPPKTVATLPEPRARIAARQPTEVLLPAVLGLCPTLSAATNPPTGRCVSYVWLVSRWLKVADNQGLISGVLGKIGREASTHGIGNASYPDGGDWQVRFEWVRGKSKGAKARTPRGRSSLGTAAKSRSRTPNRRHSALSGGDMDEPPRRHDGIAISIDSPRPSLDVTRPTSSASRTPSPRKGVSETSVTPPSHSDEDGDESDAEDSETPWTCLMILTHSSMAQPASAFSQDHSRPRTVSTSDAVEYPTPPASGNLRTPLSNSGHESPGLATIKLKVATLSPAPHHPKVVCQLKIPFPLPDANVTHGMLRKRLVLSDGTTQSTIPDTRGSGMQGLTLTAEEIKDVVCSTAFWLVVREGLGGVGKKARKGDGWRIRG